MPDKIDPHIMEKLAAYYFSIIEEPMQEAIAELWHEYLLFGTITKETKKTSLMKVIKVLEREIHEQDYPPKFFC